MVVRWTRKGGLYALKDAMIQVMKATRSSKASSKVCHQRMGHP